MLPQVRLHRLPRMADFALWAAACETGFRPAGTLETAYYNNRRDAIENIVDTDPVAAHVRELMADRARNGQEAHPTFCRSASMLAAMLWPPLGPGLAGQRVPAHSLAGCVGHRPPLRALGIEIVFGREGRLGTRTIRITAMGENRTHDTVCTVSRVSGHGDRAGLHHPPPGLEQAL